MSNEIRDRTPLERVHDKIFDKENGLEVRVIELEKGAEALGKLKDIWTIIRWPLLLVATTLLGQVGSWLARLLGLAG